MEFRRRNPDPARPGAADLSDDELQDILRRDPAPQSLRSRSLMLSKGDIAAVQTELGNIERKLEGVVLSLRWAREYLARLEFPKVPESGATGGPRPAESGHAGPAAPDPASGEG